jgi:hypothetical protein
MGSQQADAEATEAGGCGLRSSKVLKFESSKVGGDYVTCEKCCV